jgi:hypothetical protein
VTERGYTTEVFIPRTILNQPVFVPGWYIGFDVSIRIGGGAVTGGSNEWGAQWCTKGWGAFIDSPSTWGDLLLLGTDAEVRVQDAEPAWPRTQAVVPGHSYLVTILDPDRNTNLAAEDTVLLSAEVIPPGGTSAASDTEIYILRETGNNTGVFRGFIDTLPGTSGEVYGTLEVSPGAVVRLGYLDLGDSKGRRNVVCEAKLPVAAALISVSSKQ